MRISSGGRIGATATAATASLCWMLLLVVASLATSSLCVASASEEVVEIDPSGRTILKSTNEKDVDDPHVLRARAIFEWVNEAEGGYIDLERQTILKIDGNMGVFASADIPKNTVLARIPFELFIKSNNPDDKGQMPCGTVQSLARELQKGNNSVYAPYIDYLLHESNHSIPSAYSKDGKNLLLQILGYDWDDTGGEGVIPPSEPVSWIDEDWISYCGHPAEVLSEKKDDDDGSTTTTNNNNNNNNFSETDTYLGIKAATLVLQRSDDAILIPAYDNYNHRNQGKWKKWLSTKTIEVPNKYYEMTSTRVIKKGEEIFSTYNLCEDCGGRKKFYGTPELFRDYGFVERYPQRWYVTTDKKYQFDIDETPTTGKIEVIEWKKMPKDSDYRMDRLLIFFRTQIRRLRKLKNVHYAAKEGIPAAPNAQSPSWSKIPPEEWNSVWEFAQANIIAYTVALDYLENYIQEHRNNYELLSDIDGNTSVTPSVGDTTYTVSIDAPHYDPLTMEGDDNAYELYTCDTTDAFNMVGFVELEEMDTSYQELVFSRREDTDDVCMTLDNIIQICANYRPHYHEYITHAAGRYVKDVKKIMFIGGGDSMLLHEALKYPAVEKVVGLELDQTVTRKSFKHFHTSPHFEDDRVEWWFGDATKSLLLLPEEYWGSFDLVLVDLSETAMSLSVTDELDVFDALSLLLNPQGVMVKNELYLEKFSKVFDYTLEIYYESPVICSQVAILGSNNVDFFHTPTYDHGLPHNFLYKDLHKKDTRHDFMHDYRKNIASKEICDMDIVEDDYSEQKRAAGILEVVNAEQVGIELDSSIVDIILAVLKKHDLNVLSDTFLFETGVVIFEDGYIAARIYPEHDYVGFDISMWGKSNLIHSIRDDLTAAVKSPSEAVSAYKVVVGGVYGLDSWKSDQKLLGPKMKQLRNCDQDVVTEGSVDSNTAFTIAMEEIIPVTLATEITAIVICKDVADCASRKVLKAHPNVKHVIDVQGCGGLSPDADIKHAYFCEMKLENALMREVGKSDKANLLVIDPSTTLEMHQVVQSALEFDKWRNGLLTEHSAIVAWSADKNKEVYKRELLDRLRKAAKNDPVTRAEIVVQAGGNSFELGIVSTNNERSSYEYDALEQRMKARLSKDPYNAHVELRMVHGGMFNYDDNFQPTLFTLEDYDLSAAREQYKNQKPLGRQNIIQFGEKENVRRAPAETHLTLAEVSRLVTMGLNDIDIGLSSNKQFAIGDGGLVLSLGATGNFIAVYDGRKQVVVNFFTFDERPGTPERFVKEFQAATYRKMEVKLRDDQPRGINRVINFPSDLENPVDPVF